MLKPADGGLITSPAKKEMALGVYYITCIDPRTQPLETIFSDREEAVFAYQQGKVSLRQQISVRIAGKIIETTIGRILLNETLLEGFDFIVSTFQRPR